MQNWAKSAILLLFVAATATPVWSAPSNKDPGNIGAPEMFVHVWDGDQRVDYLKNLTEEQQRFLMRLVDQHEENLVRELAERDRLIEEQAKELVRVKKERDTDALTGLGSKHKHKKLVEYFENKKGAFIVAFIQMDVDFFKNVNDTYGHPVGDKVLVRIGEVILKNTRSPRNGIGELGISPKKPGLAGELEAKGVFIRTPIATATRPGGEEFTFFLEGENEEGAIALAERLRKAISKEKFRVPNPNYSKNPIEGGGAEKEPEYIDIGVTVSAGIAAWEETESENNQYNLYNASAVMKMADDALYRAKSEGRNRVVVASRDEVRQFLTSLNGGGNSKSDCNAALDPQVQDSIQKEIDNFLQIKKPE